MIDLRQNIIERIFAKTNKDGFWTIIPASHKYYPDCLHYVPNFKASLWALILLAELKCDRNDKRIQKPLKEVKDHLFDDHHGIYSLKEDHFPIPCLNGNMLYLDCYFNGKPDAQSKHLLEFFCKYQRFDDGEYEEPKNRFCSNASCYGKHTCYWGVVKLLKGISFIPKKLRNADILRLRERCVNFILKHKICYSSHDNSKIMIKHLDQLTFPNFYKGDFLEILWILKREKITSDALIPALELLVSKQNNDGGWDLERKMNNMVTSVGQIKRPNQFVTERANEVMEYYEGRI